MRKIVLAVLLSGLLSGGEVFAETADYQDYMYEYCFIEKQLEAIAIDNSDLFMWAPDDKKIWKYSKNT